MSKITIYPNNCREEILNKTSLKRTHAEYNVGKTLSATTDIGKYRNQQEDSVIILEHPENEDFKLIGVSDGVGGFKEGDLASNHIVKKLIFWFESLNLKLFEDINSLKENLREMVLNIMEDSNIFHGEATLSMAIIGKNETLIVNIGDSRIYTFKNGELMQQTRDDSEVQRLYDEEIIPFKEIMRFHKYNNYITQSIGINSGRYNPKFKIINNYDYDRVYAFTDGVTDCLSTKEIETIIKNSKGEATKEVVKKALEKNSYLSDAIYEIFDNDLGDKTKIEKIRFVDYYKVIEGGKDNTTAAEYRKR